MKVNVFFARFPYQNSECPDTSDWYTATILKAKTDHRIGEVFHKRYDDTPITMTRNRAARDAIKHGADYLLMLDSDMAPDLPGQQPFWDTTLDFLLKHRDTPCMVAAPYCGPPPHENIYVFRWSNLRNDDPDQGFALDQFTREEAAQWHGIAEVGALPTGLILIDTRVFQEIEPPWFYYEYEDQYETDKASTEDVTFTRDCSLQGIPVYCNWSSWAGHWKRLKVKKPRPITVEQIREKYQRAVLRGQSIQEKIIMVGEEGVNPTTLQPVRNGKLLKT